MNKPLLELEEKPCGDVWLHVMPAKGPQASINLGKRGDHVNPSIVHRSLISAIEEAKQVASIKPDVDVVEELEQAIKFYKRAVAWDEQIPHAYYEAARDRLEVALKNSERGK